MFFVISGIVSLFVHCVFSLVVVVVVVVAVVEIVDEKRLWQQG